ncbi:hypothetical protein MKW94_024837, partial [Papaver nudicaule]|nr:hypothetical protein [Papaver nudicaule]
MILKFRSKILSEEFGWDKDLPKKIWCRSKSNQYPNTSLVQVEGVNTKEEVQWYAGNRTNGSHYRCIWEKVIWPHGNSGVVRAKFTSNLPPNP